MIRATPMHFVAAVLASALAINLSGCDRPAPEPADHEDAQVAASMSAPPTMPAAPAPAAAPAQSATPTAEIAAPGQPSVSRDPGEVLAAWARAVETRDWASARAYWGDHGARSGLSDKDFAAKWSSLLDPRVTIGRGSEEGAAGSLYYTAPVRIIDGPRTVRGEIVLRRANDVEGASDEQLRWHIESTTLAP
ncbi:hypothetical protein [Novosphingobium huizhouense]|uniref:hypothetical protein n=1 Tax=Novosphingobium huizhouense TaxID=2866625 RepID=UPI001CD834FD|nr:hypothetical protein [Novosphingobium huizhouense]